MNKLFQILTFLSDSLRDVSVESDHERLIYLLIGRALFGQPNILLERLAERALRPTPGCSLKNTQEWDKILLHAKKNCLSYLGVDSHRRCANMSLIKIIPTKTISESENNLLVVSVSPPPTPLKSQMKRRRTRRAQSTFIPETFNFDASQCNNQKVKPRGD